MRPSEKLIRLDYASAINGDTNRRALYAINVMLFGHLFTLQVRSYQTDRPWIRFFYWKVQ